MFGMKLRSWMEARIVRARKKRNGGAAVGFGGGKEDGKGMGAVAAFPTAPKGGGLGGDQSSSSSSEPPYLGRREAELEGEDGRGLRTVGRTTNAGGEEDPRPASDYSANLSSPESAYSTGYSTDGTSPGASFPPEYYINLRTGTHYFQQQQQQQLHQNQHQNQQQPPPLPPHQQLHPHGRTRRPPSPRRGQAASSSPPPPTPPPRRPVQQPPPPRRPLPGHLALSPRHLSAREEQQQPPHPARHHSAAPPAAVAPYSPSCLRVKGRCGPPTVAEVRFAGMAAEASAARVAEEFTRRHRRTESAHEKGIPRPEVLTSTPLERRRKISNHSIPPLANGDAGVAPPIPPATLISQASLSVTDSPRQRTRIRTNPWTSTKGAVQSPGPLCGLPSFAAASEGRDIPIPPPDPPLRERGPSPPPPAPSGGGGGAVAAPPPPSRGGFGSPFALPRKRVSPALSGRRLPLRVGGGRRSTDTSSSSSSSSSRSSRCGTAEDEEEEEDATLNEMGKFDESYVYEKETDILSDSDPTDCGDEDDLQEDDERIYFRRDEDDEMDFIDNGSVELDARCRTPVNTGHCTYVRESLRVRRTVDEGPPLCCSSEAARRRATAPRPPSQRRRPSRRSAGGSSRVRRERRPPQGGDGVENSVAEREEERPSEAPKTNGLPPPQPPNNPPERLPDFAFSPEGEFAKADREADRKYRELIRQAERILVRMQGSRSLEEDEKPAASQSPVPVAEEDSPAGEGKEEEVIGAGRSSRSFAHHQPHRNQARWRTLGLECAEITLPLNPHGGAVGRHDGVHPPTPTAPEARLLTFRSVGVGREPEEGRPHCPQSEPLKRKVYTCAALQRIRRTLMGEGSEGRYEEEVEGRGLLENGIDDEFCTGINRTETMSPSRISHCRGRRASSWHKSNQIIIDEQGNEQFGHRMVLLQRHILLQTIEGLKRSLEDQSATLHDVYKSSQTTLIET